MAIVGRKVGFVHVPAGIPLPASRDSDVIYFDSNSQAIYIGIEKLADVTPDIQAYFDSYEVKSVDIVGTGTFLADAAFDAATGVLTLTRGTPEFSIAKGVDPEAQYVAITDSTPYTFVEAVSVSDNKIYTTRKDYSFNFASVEQGRKADAALPAIGGTATDATVYLNHDPVTDMEAATKQYVDEIKKKLSGAMHLLGTSTTKITDGGREHPKINGKVLDTETLNPGDVVRYSPKHDNNYTEFVWIENDEGVGSWEELGDSDSYVLKDTQIIGGECILVDGSLASDVTIHHGQMTDKTDVAFGPFPYGKILLPSSMKVDKFGHISSIAFETDATPIVEQIAVTEASKRQQKLVAGDNITLEDLANGTTRISASGGSFVLTKEAILTALGYEEIEMKYTDVDGTETTITMLAQK